MTSNVSRHPLSLPFPYTAADCDAVLHGAARVLNEVGVQCDSDNIRRILASFKGAREDGQRVYYSRSAVDEVLTGIRAIPGSAPPEGIPFALGGPWCAIAMADVQSGRARPATQRDSADAIRLLEAMGARVGVCPLAPAADTPPALSNLASFQTLLLHSTRGRDLTNQPSPVELPFFREMAHVVGRTPTAFIMALISPLRFEDKAMEFFLDHRQEPGMFFFLSNGSMPCVGSTAPMHMPGALILTIAESIALNACAAVVGQPYQEMAVRCDPFDMRFGNYVIGSPEYHLLDMACRAVFRHIHGRPRTGGNFRSMAKMPDAQAMTERSLTVMMQAFQGARSFGSVGQLSLDEVFSPEQAVLDREILTQVERTVNGIPWRSDADGGAAVDESVSLIRRGVEAGTFMTLDETIEDYRDFFTISELFRYDNISTWQSGGAASVLERATQEKQRLLENAPEFAVSNDQAREIQKIYRAAKNALG